MILGENNEKMSKSRGNVVNPDTIVAKYGADTLRLYEMFMGPLEATKPWSNTGVEGCFKFLSRVWRIFMTEEGGLNPAIGDHQAPELERTLHKTIKKVGGDIDGMRFNTAISQMMIFINECYKTEKLPRSIMERFVLVLAPFAPHLAEELWAQLGHPKTLAFEPFPAFDEALTVDSEVELALQINSKLKLRFTVPADMPEAEILAKAKGLVDLEGKTPVKEVVVPGRLVNLIVK
jgi:leucyl-tRNA synthetase